MMLAGGASTTVSFTTSKDGRGSYGVRTGELRGGFEVQEPLRSLLIVGGIVALVLVLLGIGIALWRVRVGREASGA